MDMKKELEKKRLLAATIFTFVFMSGFALASCVLGTLLPGIIAYFDLSLTQASSINIANEIGNSVSMVVALFVLDRLDKGKTLAVFGLVYGVLLVLFGISPVFAVLLGVRFFVGFFGSLLDNMCATYISDLYGERRTRYISILHTLYAIASMAAPKFAAFCYAVGGWPLAYLSSGAAIAAAGVLYIVIFKVIGLPATAVHTIGQNKGEKVQIPYGIILKNRNMRWLCAAGMLFAGQMYVSMWLPTYLDWLDNTVYTVSYSSTIMTGLYLGMIFSRIMLAAISGKVGAATYLRWASPASAVLLFVMLFVNHPLLWLIGGFIYGCVSGASYTARFVLSCQEFPEYSATATALTGIFNALGSILLSWAMGIAGDAGYYTEAMAGIGVMFLVGFAIFKFCYKEEKR